MTPRRRLSPVRTCGGWRVAAVEEWTVSAWCRGTGAIGGGGSKRPVAILLQGPDGVATMAPDGTPLDEAEVEALLPGALGRFLNDASRDTLPPEEEEEDR
jgi:hypothetical protein